MAEVQQPPEGRYGRVSRGAAGSGARSERRLKITGGFLGVGLLALIVWIGFSYVGSSDVNGSLIKYQVVSDEAVEIHLEVRKDAGVTGVCTLRATEETHGVVGHKDVRVKAGEDRVDTVVTVRTTRRATSAELVGCEAVD